MVLADSVNIARRLSSKHANDLVEENMLDSSHNYKECMAISEKLSDVNQLPTECRGFKDIVSTLEQKPSKHDSSIAFEGMGSSAAAAASARSKGQQNYAQIQRRYTNTRRFTKERK